MLGEFGDARTLAPIGNTSTFNSSVAGTIEAGESCYYITERKSLIAVTLQQQLAMTGGQFTNATAIRNTLQKGLNENYPNTRLVITWLRISGERINAYTIFQYGLEMMVTNLGAVGATSASNNFTFDVNADNYTTAQNNTVQRPQPRLISALVAAVGSTLATIIVIAIISAAFAAIIILGYYLLKLVVAPALFGWTDADGTKHAGLLGDWSEFWNNNQWITYLAIGLIALLAIILIIGIAGIGFNVSKKGVNVTSGNRKQASLQYKGSGITV